MVSGGAEILLIDILNNFDINRYEITLVTIFDGGALKNKIPSHIKYNYIFKNQFKGIYRILKFISPRWLYNKVIKDQYDVEISFKTGMPEKIIASSPNLKSKKIAWVHGDMSYQNFGVESHITKKLQKKCYEKFDKIITNSKICRQSFIDVIGIKKNVEYIYNAISYDKIIKLSLEDNISLDKNALNIISVGRLNYERGFDRLIKAFLELSSNHKVKLWIIGGGPEEKNLRSYLKDNLNKNIILLGNQENPYKYLKYADVYFNPARTESFGISLVEAMFMGLIVVSTKCGGPEEILNFGEHGILVDNSLSGIKDGLNQIIKNYNIVLAYKQKSLERAEEFDIKMMVENIEKLF